MEGDKVRKKQEYNIFYQKFLTFSKCYNKKNCNIKFLEKYKKKYFPNCPKQLNYTDCDIYTILYIKHYIKYGHVKFIKSTDIPSERTFLQYSLLEKSSDMENICLMCGEEIDRNNEMEEVLECIFCKRIIHFTEIVFEEYNDIVSTDSFRCFLCMRNNWYLE